MGQDTVVLILNYNGERFVRDTIDSLLEQTHRVNIVVIDNNSTDASVDLIKKEYPQVELIENDRNYPFGTAYNRVMTKREERFILLLNNDMVVEPDAVEKAVRLLKKEKDHWAVVFLEFQMDEEISFPYERDYMVKKRFGMDLGSKVRFGSRKDPPASAIFFWGGASLFRSWVVKKVRFDEDFDWYFEDVDLGWSVHNLLGLKCLISPDPIVHHMGGASTKERFVDKRRDMMNHRNSMLSFMKNATTGQLVRAYPEMMFHLLFRQEKRMELWRAMRHKRKYERNRPVGSGSKG